VTDQDPLIWEKFLSLVVGVVRELHEGHLERVVGHEIPVLLDGMYFDRLAQIALNREANPSVFHERLDSWAAAGDEGP
jgi:hypothetical protein